MNLEDVVYVDPLFNLFEVLDVGSLLLTSKNLYRTILPYAKSKTTYNPITLYKLFFEFDYKLFNEINKLTNIGNLMKDIIKLTNININQFYKHIMNICNNSLHINYKLNKIVSDICYLMEYYHNGQFYNNMIRNKQVDSIIESFNDVYNRRDYQLSGNFNVFSFALHPANYQPSGYINWSRATETVLILNDKVNFIDGTAYYDLQFNGRTNNFNKEYTLNISGYLDYLQHLIICIKLPQLPTKYKYKQQWDYNFFKKIEITSAIVGTIFSYNFEELLMNDLLNQDKLIKQFYNIIDDTMYFIVDFKLFAKTNGGILFNLTSSLKLNLEIGSISELIDSVNNIDDYDVINKLELVNIYAYGRYGSNQNKSMLHINNSNLEQTIHHRKFYKLNEYSKYNTIKIEDGVKLCNVYIYDNITFIDCQIKQLDDLTYEYIIPNNCNSKYLIIEYEADVNNYDKNWNDVGIYRWHNNFSNSTVNLI